MPRRILVTVGETSENLRSEDLPGGDRIGRRPPPMSADDRAMAFRQGKQAAKEVQAWEETWSADWVDPIPE